MSYLRPLVLTSVGFFEEGGVWFSCYSDGCHVVVSSLYTYHLAFYCEKELSFIAIYLFVHVFKSVNAGVQPQLIQGIRRRDGIGEGQETTA